MAEEDVKPPRRGQNRKVKNRRVRPVEVVTLDQMTEHQRVMIEAGNRPGTPMPEGTREERLAWIHRALGGKD